MPPASDASSTSGGIYEWLPWAVVAIFGLWAFYLVRKHSAKVSDFSAEHEAKELAFAEAAIHEAMGKSGEPVGTLPPPAKQALPPDDAPTITSTPVASTVPLGAPLEVALGSDPLEALAKKMRTLRIIEEKQGTLQLSVPPHGAIYKLRKGGTVALLPRMESEVVLAHYCKRFEMVACLSADGGVLIIERLEQRMVDLIDEPGTYGGSR